MDGLAKSARRRAKRREIESERLIIEEWLLIPIYMETLDGVRGKDGAGQRPTEIYSWGGIFIGPPTRHMSDWRLKLHFQFGIAICIARCMFPCSGFIAVGFRNRGDGVKITSSKHLVTLSLSYLATGPFRK